ncbi:restriction endonuclease-related protein [Micromonospora narathiwatensis]|uniref:REase associating with pPIWI RE domain-containing protein n=1 Tax=Micromonospora narathiwatensis TaxID=299146 RepID=A0A1A8ZT15_9ACTN|nr:hypothetical protein [Micromonospora narathiwatensis]SBT47015.1 hypothetical protein GA0070621_2783 [Micromonospora narathiwatensis]
MRGGPDTSVLDRRARITSAALRAAYAWSVRDRELRAFDEVARMTGVVMFELGPGRGPVAPLDLVRCLRRPLGALLPPIQDGDDGRYGIGVDEVVLLDGGDVLADAAYEIGSDYVREVISGLDPGRDWLPSWSWMRANDVENELFARLIGTADEAAYRTARQFLVECPAGREHLLAEECNRRQANRVARYVPVTEGQSYRCGERRWWWPCRVCGWPMDVRGQMVRCRYPYHTATYQVTDRGKGGPGLIAVDRRLPAGVGRGLPERYDADGAVQVEEPVWRFVVVPGATELRLARLLTEAGATVRLYPGCDRYDLDIVVGDRRWDVDVKEHATVEGLLRHIGENQPSARHIVLPDTHAGQVHAVREALPTYTILTEGQLVSQVKGAVRRRKRSAS